MSAIRIPSSLVFLLFLLVLPAAAAADDEALPSGQYGRRGTALGEWRPGEEKDQPALAVNEPLYFVAGRNDGETTARFQISFKYRLFDADGVVLKHAPWLEHLHFAYTQTSLWNLSEESAPFEDSSYRPGLFWEFETLRIGALPEFLLLRAGYEHESNGQGGEDSRSVDTLFIFPVWEEQLWGRSLVFGSKLYLYLDQERDVKDYRGYADLIVRYGNEDSWLLAAMWRHGAENRNTVQVDVSYPVRKKIIARTGGYIYLQVFQGYGESLLTYDQKEDMNVRIGFAIVR